MGEGTDKAMVGAPHQGEIPQLLERLDAEVSELEMALGYHTDKINPILGFGEDSPAGLVDPEPPFQSVLANTLDGYASRIQSARRRLGDLTNRAQV